MSLRARESKGRESWGPYGQWEVAERYVIQDGEHIVPDGRLAGTRYYHPVLAPELPARLGEVRDEPTLLSFAARWGLLGIDSILGEEGRQNEIGPGDPLWWVFLHAETVRIVLSLIEARKSMREDSIGNRIRRLMARKGGKLEYGSGPDGRTLPIASEFIEEAPIEASGDIVRTLINANIKYLHPVLVEDSADPSALDHVYTFGSLVPVIYGHLMEAAEGRRDFYRCQHCGKWQHFEPHRRGPKPRYCPPDIDWMESKCSRLARYHKSKNLSSKRIK